MFASRPLSAVALSVLEGHNGLPADQLCLTCLQRRPWAYEHCLSSSNETERPLEPCHQSGKNPVNE